LRIRNSSSSSGGTTVSIISRKSLGDDLRLPVDHLVEQRRAVAVSMCDAV
jgi:hypothetical protein